MIEGPIVDRGGVRGNNGKLINHELVRPPGERKSKEVTLKHRPTSL